MGREIWKKNSQPGRNSVAFLVGHYAADALGNFSGAVFDEFQGIDGHF